LLLTFFKSLGILIFYEAIKFYNGDTLVFFPIAKIWSKRSLIFHFAVLNLKMRFKSTYLGFLWAALEPMLYFIVLYVVFTSLRTRTEDFAIYLITGVMLFHIFARGTSGGLNSLTLNSGIISSLNIRKEFFPVVTTVSVGLLAFADLGVFFGLMPVFQFIPSWTIILLPIPLILLLFLILGLSYFLSVVSVYIRDIQIIWGIFVHALLFVSPIFWKVDEVEGILLEIHKINPLGQLIEISHKLVINGEIPPLNEWLYAIFFIIGILFVGYIVNQKFEYKIAEKL